MPPIIKALGLGGMLIFFAVAARAHDPLQSYTIVRPRADGFEIEIVMSGAAGRALVENPPKVPLTPENFASTYHDSLQAAAPLMLDLTTNGAHLFPHRVTVDYTEEYDLDFRLVYNRPPTDALHLTANFIKKMEEGHMTAINVFDATNHNLGNDDLGVDNLSFDFKLPPPSAAAPSKPSPSATPASNPGPNAFEPTALAPAAPPAPAITTPLASPAPTIPSSPSIKVIATSSTSIIHVSSLAWVGIFFGAAIVVVFAVLMYRQKN